MVSIPVEVDIPITITSTVIDGTMIVAVQSNTDLTKLTWTIGTVKPQKITPLNEGTLLIMSFRLYDVGKYNLFIGSIQMDFIGSDIYEYLQTSDSAFGIIIQPYRTSLVPAFAIAGILAAVAAGFMLNRRTTSDSDMEDD